MLAYNKKISAHKLKYARITKVLCLAEAGIVTGERKYIK